MLSIHLFGQPRLFVDLQAHPFSGPPKTLPLLAYLLLHRGQALERQQAAFTLWPDDAESDARANLRRHLHHLGKALPPAPPQRPWLLLTPSTVGWNPGCDYRLDVAEFERLSADPPGLEQAVALYTGDLLETVYDDWVFFERERLQQRYFAALETLIDQRRAQCRYGEAIEYCTLLLARDPLREDALRRLVALRYQSGDRAGALSEYERFAQRLKKEMGVEPMPETRAVYEAALRQRGVGVESQQGIQSKQSKQDRQVGGGMPFVGRRGEMERLEAEWRGVGQGGGLLLVSGEAGVGKSRLLAEFAAFVEGQGGRVLHGATPPDEHAPYQAVVDAFRGALPLLAGLEREETRLAALAALLPELRQRRRLPALPELAPDKDRMRLFDAVAGCLERLCEPRPALLILEDLHWAGDSTLALLEYLARRLSRQRLMIVGTYREEEVERQHPLRTLRRRLQDEQLASHLPLGRLDAAALAGLFDQPAWAALAADARAAAGQGLFEASQGNPLFAGLLLQNWQEAGGTEIQFLQKIEFLDGLQPLIQQRLARLTPTAQTYAEVAAVIGPAFDAEVVRETGGWSESEALSALDELLDCRLVHEGVQTCDYLFAHHLVQAGLYAAIPAGRLRRRHHRAAGVLEELYPGQRDELAGTLALHYDRGGEPLKAIPCYRGAAHNALAVFADAEALRALDRALELAGGADVAPGEHFDLLKMREAIYHRLGKRNEQCSDQQKMEAIVQKLDDRRRLCEVLRAQVLCLRALGERQAERDAVDRLIFAAQALDDPYWRAAGLHMEGHLLDLLGEDLAGAERLQQALPLYQAAQDSQGELECLAKLAEIYIRRRNSAAAEVWIQKALELSRGLNQAHLVMHVLWLMAANGLVMKDFERCHSYAGQCLDYAQRANDLFWRATTHRLLAQACGYQFKISEMRHHLDQAERLYHILQRPSGLAMVYETTAGLELDLGNYEVGRRFYQQALDINERLNNVNGQAHQLINLAYTAGLLQDYPNEKAYALRALQLTRQIEERFLESHALNHLGVAEQELGNLPTALEYLLAAREICVTGEIQAENYTNILGDLALCYVAAGDVPSASRAADELESLYPQVEAASQDSQRTLWAIARVRRAAGLPDVADGFVERAYRLVEKRSAAIPEPAYQQSYRDLIFNRQIIAAHERGEWPEPY